jgi:N-acetylglutamate synthase-like GNAT family acetyltransferase
MTIRGVTLDDAAPVSALIRELARDTAPAAIAARLKTALESNDHRVWVSEHDGRIEGVLHAFIRPALEKPVEVVVQSLVVAPGRRKTGVGRALMDKVEAWARESGHSSVALHTQDATAFYERLDYAVVASPNLMRKALT